MLKILEALAFQLLLCPVLLLVQKIRFTKFATAQSILHHSHASAISSRARVLPFSLLKKVLRFSLFGNAVETANVTTRTPLADRLVWMRPGFYSRVSGITASSETASVDRIWVCCTKSCKYIVLI